MTASFVDFGSLWNPFLFLGFDKKNSDGVIKTLLLDPVLPDSVESSSSGWKLASSSIELTGRSAVVC